MNELMEGFKSWQAMAAVLLGGPLTLLAVWWRFKAHVWRLSEQRQRPLRDLVKTKTWKKAPALHMQLALKQAYGKRLDERDFYLAMSRHNPLTLLEHRFAAEDFARLNQKGDGYEDGRNWVLNWLSPKALEYVIIGLASVLFAPLLTFVVVAFHSNAVAGTLASLESVGLVWVLIYGANKACHAHELIHCLDDKFPLVPDDPPKEPVMPSLPTPDAPSQVKIGSSKPKHNRRRNPIGASTAEAKSPSAAA